MSNQSIQSTQRTLTSTYMRQLLKKDSEKAHMVLDDACTQILNDIVVLDQTDQTDKEKEKELNRITRQSKKLISLRNEFKDKLWFA